MKKFVVICLMFLFICGLSKSARSVEIYVPGTSNPWLSGMPNGTTAFNGDIAPNQSPVLVQGIDLLIGSWIEISNVTGAVNVEPGSVVPADGGAIHSHSSGVEHSKSDILAPVCSLLGVFLNSNVPSGQAPSTLDFSSFRCKELSDAESAA